MTLQGAFSLLFVSERSSLSTPLLARLWRAAIESLVADLERKKGAVIGAKVSAEVSEKLVLRPAESGAMPSPNTGIPLPCKENEDIMYGVNRDVFPGDAPGGGEGGVGKGGISRKHLRKHPGNKPPD